MKLLMHGRSTFFYFGLYLNRKYKKMKKKLVILSGAGISQESGLKTFRDMGGIWEEYDVTEVASPEAWARNPELVLRFYNERRRLLWEAKPNAGHTGIAELEKWFDVEVVTQNVDDLHEQAGSTRVLHLHGELRKARSTADPSLVYTLNHWELKKGDTCEKGSQLRPHIVWFGEMVTEIEKAASIVRKADILVVVGTSLAVYPAAGLVNYIQPGIPVFVVDPQVPKVYSENVEYITEKAGEGVKILKEKLKKLELI
jgi:NAD-dependent deacetylase